MREILSEKEIRQVYYAYVESQLPYSLIAWEGTLP